MSIQTTPIVFVTFVCVLRCHYRNVNSFDVTITHVHTMSRSRVTYYSYCIIVVSMHGSSFVLCVCFPLCWQVNLALVLDGSSSIDGADFVLEQQFAVDTVTAFATRSLFDNGGMASYVQYASSLVASGMFDSVEGFTDFSDADVQSGGVTMTNLGIDEGTALLGATDATAAFMIVITDGGSTDPAATIIAADAARAAGIMLFAVGVGELLASSSGCPRDNIVWK